MHSNGFNNDEALDVQERRRDDFDDDEALDVQERRRDDFDDTHVQDLQQLLSCAMISVGNASDRARALGFVSDNKKQS